MNGSQLLERLKTIGRVKQYFQFPYLHIVCISSEFEGLDGDRREIRACERMSQSTAAVRKTAADCLFTLEWMTPSEAGSQTFTNRGIHWLSAFVRSDDALKKSSNRVDSVHVAHFFGYKGGQGRSTVLACLAQKLALEGIKVLALDGDIEAPSLDRFFNVNAKNLSATLLGIVRDQTTVDALPAYIGKGRGEVRLISCRPNDASFDIDFSAFALKTGLFPGSLADGIGRIQNWAREQSFDVILVDHRSGMAPATLTWMEALPGPTVVFARLDEQWRGMESVLRAVLESNPDNPGVIVSFKPDEENEDSYRRRSSAQRNDLLLHIGQAIAKSAQQEETNENNSEDIDPADIEDHWILWPYDQAFRTLTLPGHEALGTRTKDALAELSRLLDMPLPKEELQLSSIGSRDQGDLIQTEALTRLRQPGNSYRYILGRKGTGKTRIARQLALEKLGEPLLVDDNSELPSGMRTAELEFKQAAEKYTKEKDGLWWAILVAGLEGTNTKKESLREKVSSILSDEVSASTLQRRALNALPKTGTRTFLMDGIETAFTVSEMAFFIEALFRFMNTIQTDDRFNGQVEVKLFLRTDFVGLAGRSAQNLEQQLEGRQLSLYWDYQRILSFLLSRVPNKQFFSKYFDKAVVEISKSMDVICRGEMSHKDEERLILRMFPQKLSRFNILTSTFLRLHFADKQGGNDAYYPRVIDAFLSKLDQIGGNLGPSAVIDGRLDQKLIVEAHEKASAEYMDQLKQELQHLLDFKLGNLDENRAKLDIWINAFSGRTTPFEIDEMVNHLTGKTELDSSVVKRCLEQMRDLGIFETVPDSIDKWRTGRLFKSTLKMKYNRK